MAKDKDFARATWVATAHGTKWASVTPHDSTNFTVVPDALWVGGAGNIVLVGSDDVAVTFTGVPAGTYLQVSPKRVNATSTTATAIVAIYRG